MNGYLDRLAARAIGAAKVAQPVVPSVFEPIRTGDGGVNRLPPEADAETGEERKTSFSAAPSTPPHPILSPSPRRWNETAPSAPSRREDKAGWREAASSAESVSRKPDRAAWPDRAAESAAAAGPVSRFSAERLAQNGRSPAQEFRTELDSGSKPPSEPPHPEEGKAGAVASRTASPPPISKPVAKPDAVAAGLRKAGSEPAGAHGSFALADRRAEALAGDSSAAIPEIRIHIGRIEIRAVHPQPAPQPPPVGRQRTPLSIHDYLKQRGERR